MYLCQKTNMRADHQTDTICAPATGNSGGAIAVIRLSGPNSFKALSKCFSKDLAKAQSHTLHFGMFHSIIGEPIDEVLISVFQEGKSYTGEESIEISCHASSFIQQQILETLTQNGCRLADAGEFTMRAYMNGKLDLSQAEAVADLIASQSKLAHDISLKQLRGGFSNELKELREKLIHFASLVELELDFAEEDVEFADRTELMSLVKEVNVYIHKLIDSFRLGNAIKNGVPVAFVGRPNAGKSTVLNALLKEERAIVSDIPGTTRDTVEEIIQHEGIQIRLMDTAGIRESDDPIEKKGIERSMVKIKQASLVVYLFDCLTTTFDEVRQDIENYLKDTPYLLVATKSDLFTEKQRQEFVGLSMQLSKNIPLLSMTEECDRNRLLDIIYQKTVGDELGQHSTIVSNARHLENLQKASQALDKAENGLSTNITADWVAMDIRQAMYQIGQITGDISTDDLLGNIFAKFCIGK
jgi:tRNA modification GTPase